MHLVYFSISLQFHSSVSSFFPSLISPYIQSLKLYWNSPYHSEIFYFHVFCFSHALHRFIAIQLLLVQWEHTHSGSLAASNIHVLGGHQVTGAWALLCKLWRWDFEKRWLKCMGQSLHFVWYIHKENFVIWTASITSKRICYSNSL
jgi:hypothetical protein